MPFSVRLDAETEAHIRRLASATGRSKSFVVREAVARYAAETTALDASGETAFDRLRVHVGVVTTDGAHYSQDTHEKYRAALVEKQHGGSARRRRRPHRAAR